MFFRIQKKWDAIPRDPENPPPAWLDRDQMINDIIDEQIDNPVRTNYNKIGIYMVAFGTVAAFLLLLVIFMASGEEEGNHQTTIIKKG